MGPADIWEVPTEQLSPVAKVVFVGLAIAAKGKGSVQTSHGVLAKICGLSRASVVKGLKALEKRQLIQRSDPAKQIERYTLLHPRLSAAAMATLIKAEAAKPEFLCIICGKKRKRVDRREVCSPCNREARTREIAREEIQKRLKSEGVA